MTQEVVLLPPPQQSHRVLRFQFWRTVFNWVWHEKWHAGAEPVTKRQQNSSKASRPNANEASPSLHTAPSAPPSQSASPDGQKGVNAAKERPEESICQHFHNEPHCVVYAFKGLVRGAVVAWCLKSVFSLAIALFSRKMFFQPIQTIVRILLDRESLVFARFLGAMGCVYRLLQCLLCKMHNGPSKAHSAVAAFLAGSTILLDSPSRRSTVAIYLVVRGIYELARSLSHNGVVHQVPYLTQLIFAICQIPIMYSAMRSPHALNPSYRRFIYGMGNMDVPAVHLIVGKNQPDFHQCAGMAHEGTCVEYNVKDALHGIFVRAPPIFLPVHLIPALIFKHRFLRSHPLSFFKESMSSVARSCLFLATYTSFVKSGMCFWRNLLGRNADWAFALIGFSTGLSIFWERTSRHAELMVYCVPRAVETALNLFSHKLPSSWHWLRKTGAIDAFLFSCAAALFVYCADSSPGLKPLNRTIFNFVFGTATQIPTIHGHTHAHSQPHSPQTPASAGLLRSPAPVADRPAESKRV